MNQFDPDAWKHGGLIAADVWNASREVREGRNEWGRIPVESQGFQHGGNGGVERPTAVHGWGFSVTFGRWSALVTFEDGWHGWSFPFPAPPGPFPQLLRKP